MKYSLWNLSHDSIYRCEAIKVKDTNSEKEVDEWMAENWLNGASFFREEQELNAEFIQFFQEQ